MKSLKSAVSRAKSYGSGIVSGISSAVKKVGNILSSGGSATAFTAPVIKTPAPNPSGPSPTWTVTQSKIVPQVYPGSSTTASGGMTDYGPTIGTYNTSSPGDFNQNTGAYNPPRTIAAGQTPIPSSAYIAPNTISSSTLGATSGFSSLSGDTGGSTGRAATLPSAGISNPGIVSNAGLATGGMVVDPNTQTLVAQPIDQKRATEEQNQAKLYDDLRKMIVQEESTYDDPQVQEQQAMVNQRKQEVNDATARLNAIVAKQQQDLLSLRQTGSQEGVTEAVYGGQQAQINYEASVRAIPIQAQVAAAQGNLELAQDYLSQVTKIRQDKLDKEYTYKKALYESVKEYTTGVLKDRLQKLDKEADRAYAEKTKNNELAFKYSVEAAQNGQAGLSAQIASMDRSDPNFVQNLGFYAGQIKESKTTKSSERLTPTEVAQYEYDYPGAGVKIGDTWADAERKTGKTSTPGKTGPSGSNLDQAISALNVMNASGVNVEEARAKVPAGKIGVIDRATGTIGSIPPEEFDPSLYVRF